MLLLPIHGFQFFSRISHGNNSFTYICEVQIVFFIWNKFDMSVFIFRYYGLQGWCHFHSSEKRFFWPKFLRFRDWKKQTNNNKGLFFFLNGIRLGFLIIFIWWNNCWHFSCFHIHTWLCIVVRLLSWYILYSCE